MVKFNKPVKPVANDDQLIQLDKLHESGQLVSKNNPEPRITPIDSEKTLDAIAEEKAGMEKLKIPGLVDNFGKNIMKELKDYKPDPPVPTYAIQWLIHSVRSQYKGRNKRPKYCPKCKKAKIEVNFDENKATCKTCGNVFIAGSCAGFTLIGEVSRWMKEYGKNHPLV